MKKWNVLVTMDSTVSTEVVVDAETAEDAEAEALALAQNNPQQFAWELDEGNWNSRPYIADPGNAASERTEP